MDMVVGAAMELGFEILEDEINLLAAAGNGFKAFEGDRELGPHGQCPEVHDTEMVAGAAIEANASDGALVIEFDDSRSAKGEQRDVDQAIGVDHGGHFYFFDGVHAASLIIKSFRE
jgi:hypothetical protein